MSGPRSIRRLLAPGFGLALLAMAGCAKNAPQDTLEPHGPVARQIDNLINPVFIVAGVIFVLIQGLALFLTIRYRHRADRPDPVQVHGNSKLEIAWTLAPALILLSIAIPTIRTIFDLADTPDGAMRVTVVARQFWWEYRYEDLGVVTANELHIPVGQPVALRLEGRDVIHSFWVPALAGKTDVVPGRVNHMYFEADEPGTYLGQCTEYCGLSHANMRLKAIAQPPEEFQQWVANQRLAAVAPKDGTPAAEGLVLFNSKGCAGCHTIEGVSKGQVGPNLTHLQARGTFAGAIFETTPEELARWLANPPGVKPGSLMPNLNLSQAEIAKLVAYLETLR